MRTLRMRGRKGRLTARGYSFTKVLFALLLILFVCFLILPMMFHRRPPGGIDVSHKAQLTSITTALEFVKSEFDDYPPSDAMDEDGVNYCGSMKLCEAVMGRDLMGFHPDAIFRSDGTNDKGSVLYPDSNALSTEAYKANLSMRKGPYLPRESANAYSLVELYGEGNTGPFAPEHFVLCGVFKHVKLRGVRKKVGMPILYYKADTSKTAHDVDDPNNPNNIYNYRDNHALLALGVPGKPGEKHPLYEDPKIFYEITGNARNLTKSLPHRADTFVLLSAGPDGLYGTKDDVTNFDFKWKRE